MEVNAGKREAVFEPLAEDKQGELVTVPVHPHTHTHTVTQVQLSVVHINATTNTLEC